MKNFLLSVFCFLVFTFIYPHFWASATINNCSLNPNKIKIEETCQIAIAKLHPTQANVGMYQVQYNMELLKLINNKKSQKYDSIKNYLKAKTVPVVIGPKNKLYMVDRHHTMRAVWDYFKQNDEQKVYIKVIQNWSNKKDFWEAMKTNNYTYLGTENSEISPDQLPENIGSLGNDNYRAAVGLAVKWAFFEKPKESEIYFYQFKWGNCLKKLDFKLPEKLNRNDIYATAAFLHNQDNKSKMKSYCQINVTDGDSWSKMIKVLEQ